MSDSVIEQQDLQALSNQVRSLVENHEFKEAEAAAAQGMQKWPHSPVPQNLMGLVLELSSHGPQGLAHFRAALALDPGYGPAQRNLECFSAFFHGYCAFDDADMEKLDQKQKEHSAKIVYDKDHLARVVRSSEA